MDRVIVTVKGAAAPHATEVEVPVTLPARELAPLLAGALGLAGGGAACRIEAFPPGRILDPEETLADAGVWDGAWLVLMPA